MFNYSNDNRIKSITKMGNNWYIILLSDGISFSVTDAANKNDAAKQVIKKVYGEN